MYQIEFIDYVFIAATIVFCIWLIVDTYFPNFPD